MFFFLYGSDTFRSLKKLKEIKEKFLKTVEGGSLNLTELDGEKLSFADFKKEISTVSFMSLKRMVVCKNIISMGKDKNFQKEIIDFLKKDDDNESIIIFWEEEKKEKEPLSKYLLSLRRLLRDTAGSPVNKIYSQEFELLKGAALKNWIVKTAEEKGGRIDGAAVNALAERVGSDLWQMNNELDKLLSLSSEGVSLELVQEFVKGKDDENIFNLTDAIGAKNKKLGLRLLSEQLRSGANINYIITMLARQFRMLLEVKDYMVKSGSSYISAQTISRDLKIHSFVAGKLLAQVKLYEMENLKRLYSRILDIDLKSKTTSISMELLLDMLVIQTDYDRLETDLYGSRMRVR